MGGYQRYEAYQDSGIEWLGEIPAHWKVKRLKNIASCNDEVLGENTPSDYEIEYVDISSVDLVQGITDSEIIPFSKAPSRARRKVRDGDIIVSTVRTYLKSIAAIRQPSENTIVSTGFAVIRPIHTCNPDYIGYVLQSEGFVCDVVANSVGVSYPAINSSVLTRLPVIEPPLEEQKTIARFLDYKTAQIDALIAKKASLLKKLAEKRSALISQAVTKGLDPKVPMKDSGVEWLGEIPGHYQLKRLKFVIEQIIDAEHKTAPYDADGEFLVVRTTNVRNGKLLLKNGKYVDKDTYEKWTTRAVPEPGDILFTREAPAGEACLVPEEPILCLGQRMVLFKFDHEKYDGYFLLNSIYSGIADDFVKSLSLGSTVCHFNMSDIGSIPLIIPPYAEQQQISQWLELYIGKFDAQAGKVKLGIQQLKEYRTALITNAVTGAIDVRNIQIPNDLQEAA
jgi:type I restriction enzyme, S subunit